MFVKAAEVSGRIDTIEMKTDTALRTLVRPFNSVTTTLQVTGDTSTSNSANSLVRSRLSDTTSNEEETNLQPRETFTEGIDKTAKSEAGSLVKGRRSPQYKRYTFYSIKQATCKRYYKTKNSTVLWWRSRQKMVTTDFWRELRNLQSHRCYRLTGPGQMYQS
jgi:hypothetical protein